MSDFELPGFRRLEPGQADISIVWASERSGAPRTVDAVPDYSSHFHPAEGGDRPFELFRSASGYVARWTDLCQFEISSDGSSILCHPWPGVTPGDVNPFIQGRVLPLALNFQGAVTLHGAAVAVDGGVAALLGTSNTGKSTLAAKFHTLGHDLVADDLVVVWPDEGTAMVEWGADHVRLDDASLDYVERQSDTPVSSEPDSDKLRVTLRSENAVIDDAVPLRTMYLLDRVSEDELDAPEIVGVPSVWALPGLMRCVSNRTILDRDRQAEQFGLVTQLLSRVPVKQLRYPSGMERLTEVCELLNADR